MSEDDLYWAVTTGSRKRPGLCKRLGVRWFHATVAQRSVPGYPDLTLVGRQGVAFRELKSEDGVLRPEQREWRDALLMAGADWAIWRPSDYESGRVEKELRALAGK